MNPQTYDDKLADRARRLEELADDENDIIKDFLDEAVSLNLIGLVQFAKLTELLESKKGVTHGNKKD
ncbi:hypothetical protein [Hydrogenovibrio marinus]|uniref:Uncharacterized protein n=1 Tax=Hydrogenovibrio marinus TaxID=28885 RepID=A0A066ZMU8_HYDMR|nr:hypothetical protein [Hydrogenovibrio marinus]KDN94827.1 hypothetical protein EI16_00490 [Hydrogenovibrio marinus]BBN59286.1 hypothetical protein HVMH_0880 [Hydrogenovibrio marinus]